MPKQEIPYGSAGFISVVDTLLSMAFVAAPKLLLP